MKATSKHVEVLDYLRGAAIIAVLLIHTFGTLYGIDEPPWKGWFRDFSMRAPLLWFLPMSLAQAGVPIFFIVSGFCIHMSFQQQGKQWGSFFIRRFFRIYPAYLIAMFFSILMLKANSSLDFRDSRILTLLFTHLFLVHNLDPFASSGFNASFWSLAVEAQLYLLYPVLLVLAARLGWRRAMIVLAGCEIFIRGADGLLQTAGAGDTLAGRVSWYLANSPLGYWFSWALGAFIADAFLKKQPLPLTKTSPLLWLALAMVCYFIRPLDSFRFLLFAVMAAVFASRLLSGTGPKIKLPALSLAMLKKAGLWSYSLYLLHQPLLLSYISFILWADPPEYRSSPVVFLLMMATWLTIIPFAALWYKLFELPSIALGKRIIQRSIEPALVKISARGQHRTQPVAFVLMICVFLIFAGGNLWVSEAFTPQSPEENSNRAWTLATDPDPAKRNGALAVKLAEYACKQTRYQEPKTFVTLAAAYAETGRFDAAIAAAEKANALAEKLGNKELLHVNQDLLGLYQQHQPYHQPPANTGK